MRSSSTHLACFFTKIRYFKLDLAGRAWLYSRSRPPPVSHCDIDIDVGDMVYEYAIEATDVDADNLVYSLTAATDGIIITDNIVSWPAPAVDVYTGSYTLSVTDGTVTLYQSADIEVIQFRDCEGVNNGSAIEDYQTGDCIIIK